MRKAVQLALMGSLAVAAASPLATPGDEPPAAAPAAAAEEAVGMMPLPAYEVEPSGQPVRVWTI